MDRRQDPDRFAGAGASDRTEKQMAVRVIGYEGANYRSQYKAKQITPVITLVLYFGTEKRWQYPQNLKALMDIPDGLESYVNDYHIHVFEIAWLTDEQINMFQSDFFVLWQGIFPKNAK